MNGFLDRNRKLVDNQSLAPNLQMSARYIAPEERALRMQGDMPVVVLYLLWVSR